jgi:hypothetical protein
MPIATLSFELPEEATEFREAVQGPSAKGVLWQLDEFLRMRVKHGELSAEVAAALQEVRDHLHQACSDSGVDLA